ncbi:hypothetical protein D9758_012556 [Tetrapyrgos nigripes]|uniref:NmrA-like domain-containing protein n=1 Tax=Tetrapyrgos nigripes TaxID=182062 RepID=A0A8H5CHG3_9AGAR|nr:hypothetical protein D9758_012556 [Tetrapyrgos nigripes]
MSPSQRIAVAGGTGHIGLHIVESLLSLSPTVPFLHIIVLSRSIKPEKSKITFAGSSAPIIAVDYNDTSGIESILREHNIDTVISALYGDADVFDIAQQNLLTAALNVPTIRRFAPSELSIDSETADSVTMYYLKKRPILQRLREIQAARSGPGIPSFEYTKFVTGLVMNYLASGNPKSSGEDAHGHMFAHKVIFDFENGTAEIPGDGQALFWMSRIQDMGEFIAHATQLDVWPEQMDLVGDMRSMNEIRALAEAILGKKLDVTYLSEEELQLRLGPNPSSLTNVVAEVMISFARGEVKRSETYAGLKDIVKPVGLEQFLRTWWS